MNGGNMQQSGTINSTYKSKDTEEFLDVLFYRPLGYALALASKTLGLSPNAVTIISIFIGVAAGHFFYYKNLNLNLIGIALLIFANALDSADGQLARITNNRSRFGRILDGFAGNLWFVSIYLHLWLRYMNEGVTPFLFVFVLLCGISHSIQSAMADYYRNYYMFFKYGKEKSEIDKSGSLRNEYEQLSWRKNFYRKFLLRVYVNYTVEQEFFSVKLRALYDKTISNYGADVPEWLRNKYVRLHKPLIKYFNILTTNTRMIVLFIGLILGIPVIYWIFELTILNILLIYVVWKQERSAAMLLNELTKRSA